MLKEEYPWSSMSCHQPHLGSHIDIVSDGIYDELKPGRKRGRTEDPLADEFIPLSKRINCLTIQEPDLLQRHPYMPQINHTYYEENRKLYFLYLERMARNDRHHPY